MTISSVTNAVDQLYVNPTKSAIDHAFVEIAGAGISQPQLLILDESTSRMPHPMTDENRARQLIARMLVEDDRPTSTFFEFHYQFSDEVLEEFEKPAFDHYDGDYYDRMEAYENEEMTADFLCVEGFDIIMSGRFSALPDTPMDTVIRAERAITDGECVTVISYTRFWENEEWVGPVQVRGWHFHKNIAWPLNPLRLPRYSDDPSKFVLENAWLLESRLLDKHMAEDSTDHPLGS